MKSKAINDTRPAKKPNLSSINAITNATIKLTRMTFNIDDLPPNRVTVRCKGIAEIINAPIIINIFNISPMKYGKII